MTTRVTGWARNLGRATNRRARRLVAALVAGLFPVGANLSLPEGEEVRRLLLVRANYRMGNVILATSLLPVLQARYPRAQIDWLVGENGAALLAGLPQGQVYRISRSFAVAPWRFVALFRELRRQGYDVAIDGGMTSFSGAFYAWLSGARHRIGGEGGSGVWLTTRLALPPSNNVYAATGAVAAALGVAPAGRPRYEVTAEEAVAAGALLARLRSSEAEWPAAPVGVFVGGHREKRWPRAHWLALLDGLARVGVPTLVFVGPEEAEATAAFAARAGPGCTIVPPQPLRLFAALVARTRLLVTPDSGPLHLASALGVPSIVVLQQEGSRAFVPPEGRVTGLRPGPDEVLALVTSSLVAAPPAAPPAAHA